MKKLSFLTYLEKTPKKKVIRFLRNRITSRIHEGMTKPQIYHTLDQYGLLKHATDEINIVRGHVDFIKYGL